MNVIINATAVNVYGACLNALGKNKLLGPDGYCNGFIILIEPINNTIVMNPKTLVAHPNPIVSTIDLNATEYTIPPTLPPVDPNPVAKLRFMVKYPAMTATDGTNRKPVPRPIQIPWERRTCQYVVEILVIMIPRTTKKEPVQARYRKYPLSYKGPVRTPTNIRRKAWIDPIQEIFDAGTPFRWSVA